MGKQPSAEMHDSAHRKREAILHVGSLGQSASERIIGAAGPAGSKDCGVNGSSQARSPSTARGAAFDDASWRGTHHRADSVRGLQCWPSTAGTHHQAERCLVTRLPVAPSTVRRPTSGSTSNFVGIRSRTSDRSCRGHITRPNQAHDCFCSESLNGGCHAGTILP